MDFMKPRVAVAVMLDLMGDTETYENPEYFRGLLEGLSNACGMGSDEGKELLHQAFINERAARAASDEVCWVCGAIEGTDAYDNFHDSQNCWSPRS